MDTTDLLNCCKERKQCLPWRNISIEDESEGYNPNVTRGGNLPSFLATRLLVFQVRFSLFLCSVQVSYLLFCLAGTDQ